MYSLNNNLDMLNNQHMDPATEQVLVQGKILTTGIVWWLVFRQPLGTRKWLSLVLLCVGTVIAGWPKDQTAEKTMYIDSVGVLLVTLYVWVSACAGVYNEWLYKSIGKADSIHVSNVRLYTIGIIANGVAHLGFGPADASIWTLTKGYNVYVWLPQMARRTPPRFLYMSHRGVLWVRSQPLRVCEGL